MKKGKYLQVASGSRSRSIARAEDKARRSRKRADHRVAMAAAIRASVERGDWRA